MSAPSLPSGHIASLDGLRTVSILIVFLSHVGLEKIFPGIFGVTVFFFISGYLITVLMLREWQATGTIALRAFWLRRVLRLGPPLALALAVALLLTLAGANGGLIDPATLAAQVFFYFNYWFEAGLAQQIPGTQDLWSLSVEEHFYLLWPLVFPVLLRQERPWPWLIAAFLAFPVWRMIRAHATGLDELAIAHLSDTRLDSLLFGCALAIAQARGVVPPLRRPGPWIALGLLVILVTFALRGAEMRSIWRFSLQGLGLVPVFHFAVTRPDLPIFAPLNWPWVKRIGVWSYSFYLIHHPLLEALAHLFPGLAGGVLWAVTGGALALGWAALIHAWVERPMARLRQRLRRGAG